MFSNIHPLILVPLFLSVLIQIALLIIGMFITTGKIKSTKILGIGFVISAILGFISNVLYLIRNTAGSPELIGALSQISNVVSVIATLAGSIFICLFIHKNYGCNWIYFPILAQPIVSAISTVAFRYVFSRMGDAIHYVIGTGLSSGLTALVIGTVEAVILIIVFYKNRKNEKIIPHAWIIRLVSFCFYLILPITSVVFYTVCLSAGAGGKDLYFDFSERFLIFQYVYSFFNSLVSLAMPIYILVMTKKAEKRLEETSAYIED